MIPAGQTYVEYQLSVEPLDPQWSAAVGPYAPAQVAPSGSFAPVVITVASGANPERDILMLGSEIAQPAPGSGSTYQTPAPLPQSAAWCSWISGYGTVDFFQFTAQANRTASVAVTAFDESGNPTESKLQPVIGIWELSDQSGDAAPAATPSAFNSVTFGMSRLDAEFSVSESYRLGIADYRGDGRPDYFYQASVLYSDTVTPARLSVAGGVTTLAGLGFVPALAVAAGGNTGSVLTQSATAMLVALPSAAQDGTATIQVTDPVSGSYSLFAVPPSSWTLEPVSGTSQVVPNGQSFQPLIMRVTDGSSTDNPVLGANVTFATTLERNPQGPGSGPPPGSDLQGQDAMPVILGTSQVQLQTAQDGTASITPSVGNLGPCDAFIVVIAGAATAQFELESVDPISSAPQTVGNRKLRTPPPDRFRSPESTQ